MRLLGIGDFVEWHIGRPGLVGAGREFGFGLGELGALGVEEGPGGDRRSGVGGGAFVQG